VRQELILLEQDRLELALTGQARLIVTIGRILARRLSEVVEREGLDRVGEDRQTQEPGADLAVALAIASAARGVPVREGAAAFGEIGLTGRLRHASQAERRLEECAKFGVATVLVPEGTTARSAARLAPVETLRAAIVAGLEARPRPEEAAA